MLVLALDTSSLALSCALCDVDAASGRSATLATSLHLPPEKHGDLLPGALLALLAQSGKSLEDVSALVVGLGPGSFTGLRVGLASAKAIAYARKLPLLGASSLRGLARGVAGKGRLVVPTLEARKAELYAEVLEDERTLCAAAAYRAPALVAKLRELSGEGLPLLVGPGAAACRAELNGAGAPAEWWGSGELLGFPSAAALVELIVGGYLNLRYDQSQVFALQPDYVKPSEAEVALSEGRVGGLGGGSS